MDRDQAHSEPVASPSSGSVGFARKHLLWLFLAICAAFGSGVAGEFVWIDVVEIEEAGYRVRDAQDFSQLWSLSLDQYLERDSGTPEGRGGYWRPIYALGITFNWAIWGDWVVWYHIENILWHGAVVAGLYLLGRVILGGPGPAFWAALLFAVHPLGVHSVTWISGRKDTMCAAFAVFSLLSMLRAVDSGERRARLAWSTVSSVLLLLALLSKELALVAPAFALVLVATRTPNSHHSSGTPIGGFVRNLQAGAFVLVPLWGVAFFVVLYRMFVLGGFGLSADRPTEDALLNLAVSAALFTHYESVIVFPRVPSISDAFAIPDAFGPAHAGSIALQGALGIVAAVGLWKRRPWAIALAWFFIWLLPASGLVPLRHLRAERYLYPASWGLLAAIVSVFAFAPALAPLRARRAALAVPAVVALGLAGLTAYASTLWKDEETLFRATLDQDPRHLESRLGLASLALREERYDEAIELGREAIRRADDPGTFVYWSPVVAYTNLGLALYHDGQHRAALRNFEEALAVRPGSSIALYHTGLALLALGDHAGAAERFARALEIAPGDDLCRANYGLALLRAGRVEEAGSQLSQVASRSPDDAALLINLGSAQLVLERFDDAAATLERAIAIKPDLVQQAKLAWCKWELGERQAARDLMVEPARELPNDPVVRFVQQRMLRP